MKILFCIYELDYADHISIAYLSAVAKKRGHTTYFSVLSDFSNMVKKIRPDIVAYSLNIYGFDNIVAKHKELKQKYMFKSIGGGPQATMYSNLFQQTEMDVYCIGEGELAWNDYLEKLEQNLSYDNVPNLITPVSINPVRQRIDDLNTIPVPDRDLVLSNSFLKDTPKKTFYATRGCPYSCTYCANNFYNTLYKGKGRIIRRFSVERIIEEIENVKTKYRMDFVKFGDDLFAYKPDKWLEDFAKLYSQKIKIPFNCNLRFDIVNDELLKILKSAGCYSVSLSVDSASEYIREKILGRQMKSLNFIDKLNLINSYKINTWNNYMLAVPESTLEDDLESINISHKGKVSYTNYTTAVPVRGTGFYNYSIENEFIDKSYFGDMSGIYDKSPFTCFTDEEKNIRYNIQLLGPLVCKLPTPLRQLGIFIIKHIKPNTVFKKIQQVFFQYMIEHTIYKIK